MPQGPVARLGDQPVHPLPPMLGPGPGSPTVLIGMLPAWRGMPLAAVAALASLKAASDATIQAAEAATLAAAGTPGAPAALAAEQATKTSAATSMASTITSSSGGADIHMCAVLLPAPPHGAGVVTTGSSTVLINNLPACRQGDTIIEAVGPPNQIAMGCTNVIIGDSGSGAQGAAMVTAAMTGVPFCEICQGK